VAKQTLMVFPPHDPDLALAVAIVLHAFGFLPLAVAGSVALLREGLSFTSLQSGVTTAAPEPPVPTPLRPQ
jgi:hypothetical protein